jgi:hypothetical protein
MLPNDSKERKQETTDENTQSMVTDHFKPETEEDKPIVYSDKAFSAAAIEWLVDTDLVSFYYCLPHCATLISYTSAAASSFQQTVLQEDG